MKLRPTTTAILLVAALGFAAPVLAEKIPQSIRDEATGEGSARTDPGRDVDRATEETVSQSAIEDIFKDLDENQDDRLDEDELNAYGSSAAGTYANGSSGTDTGKENLEYYDADEDGAVTRDEFQSKTRPEMQSQGVEHAD